MIEPPGILNFLACKAELPGIRALNRLFGAYIRKVPWESAFRIVKRAETAGTAQCPRWPDEFWQDAFRLGGGGTCFEINYALFDLLRALGYSGYLTVNNMGEKIGCHAAVIILLDGRKYLVDAGIPLLKALPFDSGRVTGRGTWLHTYSIHPDGEARFQVMRSRHPQSNIYTLLDEPVAEPDYRRVVEQDYGADGRFLDRVILVKIIGERLWRFSSSDLPWRLEWFGRDGRGTVPLENGSAARMLAGRFQMDERKIQTALEITAG